MECAALVQFVQRDNTQCSFADLETRVQSATYARVKHLVFATLLQFFT